MPVRATESTLPNGLQAKDLGQSVTNGNFILISYLTQPLHYEEGKKPLDNTYVVFDTGGASEPASYLWKFEFTVTGQDNPVEHANLVGIEGGAVFHLNTEGSGFDNLLQGKTVAKVKITVSVTANAADNLVLEQTVQGLDEVIEKLIENPSTEKGAVAGAPTTTRKLANDYKDYLIQLGKDKGEAELEKVSLNLLATLLYQAMESDAGFLSRESEFFPGPDEEDWMHYANDPGAVAYDDLVGSKIGILNVKPHIFYYLFQPPGGGIPYQNLVFDKDQKSLSRYEKDILTNLNGLNANEKIDLVNRLRFPKSCLYSVWTCLKHLKERHADYLAKVLDKNHHATNRECISTIVTEFETAPQNNLGKPSSTAAQAYDVMYSKWMQEILETPTVQMEIVKIKVLDIRSGAPLKNARVRKLVVYGEHGGVISKFGTNGGIDLLYQRDRIAENDPLRAAQIALLRLGYAPAPTKRENANEELPAGWRDGAWGGQSSQAYNLYWQHRLLNNDMNAGPAPANRPKDINLREIKNDYNGHAYTDDEGVLEVRIPKKFMNGKSIKIDIQFWEMPFVREEIKNDSGTPLTRNSTDETVATGFNVSWVGGTGANQKIEWTDYIINDQVVPAAEFGWNVSKDDRNANIKPVQRLIVKTDEDVFEGYDTDLLSKFYDADSYPIHFVLFGMVWCQPVWDGLGDPVIPAIQDPSHVYITENIYCNDNAYNLLSINGYTDNAIRTTIGKNLHIVSNVNMQTLEPLRQKGYGALDNRPDPDNARTVGGHSGYDIRNVDDGPVFAIHGGDAESRLDPKLGHYTRLFWDNNRVDFAHLRAVNPRPPQFPAENTNPRSFEPVCAGEVIGYAGWSGNLNLNQPQHTHIRYRSGPINGPWGGTALNNPPGANDPNRFIIPHNELSLVFPCKCKYGTGVAVPTNCNFENATLVINGVRSINKCFAPIELCCPYMNVNDVSPKAPQKIQSQLKNIWIKNIDPLYMDPGDINGIISPTNIANVPTTDLTNGTAVVKLAGSRHGGRLIEIRHTQNDGQIREGWIESSLINAANQLAIPAWAGLNALSNIIADPVGKSRMAIYIFRKINHLLNFADYASNFYVDAQTWAALNAIAPIRTPG